ncbi:MAG: twin-arginine translocase subunit TatC [Syntrophorhabdaceae bacterium]|nr:twin-arginine translocase subunit TatC [Syntrophorhabdaceae bacterium]
MEREKLITFLTITKKIFLKVIVTVVIVGTISFIFSKPLLIKLLKNTEMKVYYYTLPEVFFSTVELAIFAGAFFSFPFIVIIGWLESRSVVKLKPRDGLLFCIFTIVLFYTGTLFCYFIVLPSGIKFLVGYENDVLKAMISVEKFVTFCATMVFAFGITFELPVILLLISKKGLVKAKTLAKGRRFAILFITIASAVITPTPDVYNMMLLAVPMYILFEIGLLLMKLNERKQNIVDQTQ